MKQAWDYPSKSEKALPQEVLASLQLARPGIDVEEVSAFGKSLRWQVANLP